MNKRNNNHWYKAVLPLLALLLVFATGCSDKDDPADQPGQEQEASVEIINYKVAVIMPLSNEIEKKRIERTIAWAQENVYNVMEQSYDFAIQLDIEWYDEDKEDMQALASELAYRDDLLAIIGPRLSKNVAIMASECVVSLKPLIVPNASSAELIRMYANEGNFLWSLVESDISQCETLLTIAQEEGCQRVSLLAPDDIYGQTFTDWFAFQANELNMQVDQMLKYTDGTVEQDMQRALATQPEALICVPAEGTDVKRMLEQYDPNGKTRLLFSDEAFQQSVLQECGELMEGVEGTGLSASPDSGFDIAYEVRFGETPNWDAYLYDAVFLTLLGAFDLYTHEQTDLNASLRHITTTPIDIQILQGMWMPGMMSILLMNIKLTSYFPISGASGMLEFDAQVFTNVVSSTYSHWLVYQNQFLPIDYRTSDGSHRTNANMASWNWKKEKEQTFETDLQEPEYPPLNEKWAVVIAGSKGWSNYRHQADALSFYQLLKLQGYDDDHIVLIEEDDIANNPSNFDPGKIYIDPNGTNVYENAQIDYTLDDLAPEDLIAIFSGQRSDRLPHVISPGEQDNVIVFWSGHGNHGELLWGDNQGLSATEAEELFRTLHERGAYRKMMWIVEACYGGSVMSSCTGIPGIMGITSAGEWETSKPDIPYKNVWLSNRFTYTLLNTLYTTPTITLRELYYDLFKATTGSHVQVYNEAQYGSVYKNSMEEYL